jgi:hypothetical protein
VLLCLVGRPLIGAPSMAASTGPLLTLSSLDPEGRRTRPSTDWIHDLASRSDQNAAADTAG